MDVIATPGSHATCASASPISRRLVGSAPAWRILAFRRRISRCWRKKRPGSGLVNSIRARSTAPGRWRFTDAPTDAALFRRLGARAAERRLAAISRQPPVDRNFDFRRAEDSEATVD